MKILIPANHLAEVVYFLAVCQHLPGGPHTLLIAPHARLSRDFDMLVELCAKYCPWVEKFKVFREDLHAVDLDMTGYPSFRNNHSLLASQAIYCGVTELDIQRPWIVPPRATLGRVVISRSLPRQNSLFPWDKVLRHYASERLVFCGTPAEHQQFQATHRVSLAFSDSASLVSTVELVGSAKLVIANSNEVLALAEAVKAPVLVELSTADPDCVVARPNTRYSFSGRLVAPGLKPGAPDVIFEAEAPVDILEAAAGMTRPELGWWYPRLSGKRDMHFYTMHQAIMEVKADRGLTTSDTQVEEAVLRYTVHKHPEQFLPHAHNRLFQKVLLAFREAGVQFNLSDCFTIPKVDLLHL